jgi:hypothetical protein
VATNDIKASTQQIGHLFSNFTSQHTLDKNTKLSTQTDIMSRRVAPVTTAYALETHTIRTPRDAIPYYIGCCITQARPNNLIMLKLPQQEDDLMLSKLAPSTFVVMTKCMVLGDRVAATEVTHVSELSFIL